MGAGMSLRCAACAAPVDERSVDRVLGAATCGACGTVLDLASKPGLLPPRPPDALPLFVEEKADGDGLRIRWPSRKERFRIPRLPVAAAIALAAAAAWAGLAGWIPPGVALASIMATVVDLLAALSSLWATGHLVVQADGTGVSAGWEPGILGRPVGFANADLRQVLCVGRTSVDFMEKLVQDYEVRVVLRDGSIETLLRTKDLGRALFVERRIEARLRLADRAAAFEAGAAGPGAAAPARVPCDSCGAPLDTTQADRATKTVRCGSCGNLSALGGAATVPHSPLAGISIPVRFSATYGDGVLQVRWRWFHGRNLLILLARMLNKLVLLLLVAALVAALAYPWTAGVALVTLFLALLYRGAAIAVNRSELTADAASLRLRYGPLPLPPWRSVPRRLLLRRGEMTTITTVVRGNPKADATNRHAAIVWRIKGKPIDLANRLEHDEARFLAEVLRRVLFKDAPLER